MTARPKQIYNASMRMRTADYRDAIERLPEGATLVVPQAGWDDYERFLEELADRPHLRLSYHRGRLEIMSPLPEHEEYSRFIDDLVRAAADRLDLNLEKRGSATWKREDLAIGVEADACYYVERAERIIGKRAIDLESDPPPDIVVEIDLFNQSLSKLPIYAALSVPEIWRYDGTRIQFYELVVEGYREISESRFFAGLTPALLSDALEQSKTEGQTAALRSFRQRLQDSTSEP